MARPHHQNRMTVLWGLLALTALGAAYDVQMRGSFGETPAAQPIQINGIFPGLTATAASGPTRSECGTGALMPWADNLYMVSYLSVPDGGSGTGLYCIHPNMTMSLVAPHNSTYANRMIHVQSDSIIIGMWAIDVHGKPREFSSLAKVRIGASAVHLTDPDNKVYMLSMDGPLYECDVHRMNCTQLFDLVAELNIPKSEGEQPHFKAAHSMAGKLYVATNTFEENDYLGVRHGGRLASWSGPGTNWTILESYVPTFCLSPPSPTSLVLHIAAAHLSVATLCVVALLFVRLSISLLPQQRTAFVEVTGRSNFGRVVYALGWDKRSAILKVLDNGDGADPSIDTNWQTYRLPKASHAYDHLWQTEWPRIREVETERYLVDMHGMFYELSPLGWAGSTWGVRPVSQHLRMIPDFAAWRGMLVLGGNQVSSIFDNNIITGQAQSGLWFGKTDDLWQFGKPKGWGGPWRYDAVTANAPSDPYLMTGFDHMVAHVRVEEAKGEVDVTVQIDFTGIAGHMNEAWSNYTTLTGMTAGSYKYVVFEAGFSAHWVRFVTDADATMTAYLHYS
ncbi:uncharacterized protein MONBRDRAFT_9225 [Monosiga brevicollis MX1]|uniref:Uncharacterized protein n=1 Tax=Monosiga brevicollis TaxID=81824 RepID=A9V2G8_MONBE|nr:uncharacterized protein MONBRDRAFT_9225 [Monosiga brevicollis MX1]EDQ88254.1 predicted protein [Monosiga brevicollis MX1]|eukprot:XP_001746847.1 hypothetical protein [Monosiga brevicollis MX1]